MKIKCGGHKTELSSCSRAALHRENENKDAKKEFAGDGSKMHFTINEQILIVGEMAASTR